MGDRHCSAAEIDLGLTDRVLGRPQRRDGARHLVGLGTVAQGVGPQVLGPVRDGRRDFGCAVHRRAGKGRRAEDVVKVIVRQHDVADCATSDLLDIGLDGAGLGQCRPGVDQQCARPAVHQPDGDVEKR